MNTEERIKLFDRELSYIEDNEIRDFAKMLLKDADEYFFIVPASSSGKYHPDFARGNGGLVRHTKAVCYFTNEIIRSEIEFGTFDSWMADLLRVAALAHDIKKQGDGIGGHTVAEHPQLASDYVRAEWKKNHSGLDKHEINVICNVIESHMGPWQTPKPIDRENLVVYYADYIASRKEIVGLNFIPNSEDDDIPDEVYEANKPIHMTVEDYVFDFGKTKGKTIKESYEVEPGYIKWMANKEGFGNVDVQNLVKEFLKAL